MNGHYLRTVSTLWSVPSSVRELLVTLASSEPGRPRLTWYGPEGERVELSGRVLVNWVTKATNLLVEEYDAGPGLRVGLDLPAHWRTLVWALAAWTCGAAVTLGREGDVVATHRPGTAGTDPQASIVAVALPALATAYPEPLPAYVLDGAADLMTRGDVLAWLPATDRDAVALETGPPEPGPTYAGLLTWATARAGAGGWPTAPRVLVGAPGVAELLAAALAAWSADGSVVVVADGAAPDLTALAATERVTARA